MAYVRNVYLAYYAAILLIMAVFLAKLGWNIYKNGGVNSVKEAFQSYGMKPLGYMKTGNDPLRFVRQDRYRKPYRYPLQFVKSYPVPHYSFLD